MLHEPQPEWVRAKLLHSCGTVSRQDLCFFRIWDPDRCWFPPYSSGTASLFQRYPTFWQYIRQVLGATQR